MDGCRFPACGTSGRSSRRGQRLYPAFPYASYTMLTDEDVLAIKAYLFSLQPVHSENLPNTFKFPYNQRWLMFFWSTLFNSNDRFRPVDGQSPEWNRGAYLVEATAHCGECHTPRNAFQALNNRLKFSGGVAEGWNAYNITLRQGYGHRKLDAGRTRKLPLVRACNGTRDGRWSHG